MYYYYYYNIRFFFNMKLLYTEIKDMMEEKTVEGFQEFNAFLEEIGGCITDDTLHAMENILQGMVYLEST